MSTGRLCARTARGAAGLDFQRAPFAVLTASIRSWEAGEPRAQAWREAQLSLLRSEEFAQPYYWATFTLTGQWR